VAAPSALPDLTDRNQTLSEVFGIQTRAELGNNAYVSQTPSAGRTQQQDLVPPRTRIPYMLRFLYLPMIN